MSRERRKRWGINQRFVIGKPGNPMMERWRLIQTPWFGIYVHFIYREDLDLVPHDHPWNFWTFVLRGGYVEEFHRQPELGLDGMHRSRRRGRLYHFPIRHAHRIVDVAPRTVTLVLVGRKLRIWGFYEGGEWVDYQYALALRPTEGDPAKRVAS